MILSDREIRAALARDALRITPDPDAEAWSSTALDLRLASEIIQNVGPLDVKLEARKPICQLIVELVDGTPEKGYEGKFSIQRPTPSS